MFWHIDSCICWFLSCVWGRQGRRYGAIYTRCDNGRFAFAHSQAKDYKLNKTHSNLVICCLCACLLVLNPWATAAMRYVSSPKATASFFCIPHLAHFSSKLFQQHVMFAASFCLWNGAWIKKDDKNSDVCRPLPQKYHHPRTMSDRRFLHKNIWRASSFAFTLLFILQNLLGSVACLSASSALKSRERVRDDCCFPPTDLIVAQKNVYFVCFHLDCFHHYHLCWNCSKTLYMNEVAYSPLLSALTGSVNSISSEASKCTHTGLMSRPVSAAPNLRGLVSLLHHVCFLVTERQAPVLISEFPRCKY